MADWIAVAPGVFILGVFVGLALSSRYQLVRRRDRDREKDQGGDLE